MAASASPSPDSSNKPSSPSKRSKTGSSRAPSQDDSLEADDVTVQSSPVALSRELIRTVPQTLLPIAAYNGTTNPAFPDDPLLFARCTIERGGQIVDEDLMQSLLVPGAFPRTIYARRLACEYSWDRFEAKLESNRIQFTNESEALYLLLELDGQTLYRPSAPIEYGGQFRIALDQALSLCKDRITSEPNARRVTLRWEIRSRCDPPLEDAASEQQDVENALPEEDRDRRTFAEASSPLQEPGVEGTENQDVVAIDTDEEEVLVPEPEDAPADEIDRVTISSDSDSEDAQENDGPLDTMVSTRSGQIDDVMEKRDNAAGWRQTCAFFGHDESSSTIAASHCRKLPGTNRALRPHQMSDVHEVFQSVTNGTGDLGAILAHQMGVGKTMTYQAIMAVRRLAIISAGHYKIYPRQHDSPDGRCGLVGRPFGIQCACEKGGLTAKIVEGLSPGATLLLVPASLLEQTLREANAYFSPKVTFGGLGAGQQCA
ncbi:hypothetical protein LY78DRAFT_687362 [Colletotrichum sublineola]|nr:hypothetical protein LY78DRAFT_687362 [Colletotrichum sublineola]